MPQNLLSQKNIIIEVVILAVILGGGYFGYISFFSQPSSSGSESANMDLLDPKVKQFIAIKDRIKLEDVSFFKKDIYKELVDYTVEIETIVPPGRPNPFIPYAVTGPTR